MSFLEFEEAQYFVLVAVVGSQVVLVFILIQWFYPSIEEPMNFVARRLPLENNQSVDGAPRFPAAFLTRQEINVVCSRPLNRRRGLQLSVREMEALKLAHGGETTYLREANDFPLRKKLRYGTIFSRRYTLAKDGIMGTREIISQTTEGRTQDVIHTQPLTADTDDEAEVKRPLRRQSKENMKDLRKAKKAKGMEKESKKTGAKDNSSRKSRSKFFVVLPELLSKKQTTSASRTSSSTAHPSLQRSRSKHRGSENRPPSSQTQLASTKSRTTHPRHTKLKRGVSSSSNESHSRDIKSRSSIG
ncbi:unnamed protein product [Caenorhabditis auriculariae]|uniref:Uncharacterized protein n=1 Tax=Caenorhabditis auriculariae TaxID=2777116 RepID=A0A8S1HPI8_9PELO|nr:unnamed protein product [Caenorhabditis auriculariae]